MKPIDIEDFNNKMVNQIYKEIDIMVERVDKKDMNALLILQEKLIGLLIILKKENE